MYDVQDPVLFSGTVRYNLDPFDEHKDYQLWDVLEEVFLMNDIASEPHYMRTLMESVFLLDYLLDCLLNMSSLIIMTERHLNVTKITSSTLMVH